jgi:hypothetical protein
MFEQMMTMKPRNCLLTFMQVAVDDDDDDDSDVPLGPIVSPLVALINDG